MRICSFLPSATEIVYALGLGDSIVGVTHECDYPPQARKLPMVVRSRIDPYHSSSSEINASVARHLKAKKSIYTVDMDLLKEANPDLILTQELCDVCALDYDEVQEAARSLPKQPKIISLTPTTLDHILQDITRVGDNTGKSKEAERLVSQLKGRIEKIKERVAHSDLRPKVACVEWLDPIYCAGHWVPEMVEIAGGLDGLAKAGSPSQRIPWSKILEFQSDVMILMPCGFDVSRTIDEYHLLKKLPGWIDLPAIKENRTYAVNGSAYFNRPGPRLIGGLEILAQIIHPEIFPWTAAPDAARRLG